MNYYKLMPVKYLMVAVCSLGMFVSKAQVYVLGASGNATTCSGTFYDSGNLNGAYGNNETFKITFCSNSGQPIYVQFTAFNTEASLDVLTVYNGATTTSPVIGSYSGTSTPGTVVSNNGSNCITFQFVSDGSVTRAGWTATIGCGTPPPPPPPAANTTCAVSSPFCTSTNYNFPAATNTTAEIGPDYDCLLTQPNPVWYYLQIAQSGNLGISMSNTSVVDVDFVCWGPFNSSNACNQLTGANVVDCSYSAAATEDIDITGAVAGQYYILCVTNYSNQPTNFILTTDGTSTATTNCALLCNIAGMTANVTGCVGNTHTVSGALTVQYPPVYDTLTITANGVSTVIMDSFTTNVPYSLTGIPTTGGPYTITAQFSSDTSCRFTQTYTVPTITITPTVQRPLCNGAANGVITVTSNAAPVPVYTWSNSLPSNDTVTGISAGSYTVTVTGGNGCSASTTVSVTQPTAVVLGLPVITQSTCVAGGSITVTASGGTGIISYDWSTGDSTNVVTGLAAATYTLTVTDANGCTALGTYVVPAAPGAITISGAVTDALCSGSATGEIAVSASGGTGAINLVWSTTETTQFIDSLPAGIYSVTATDQNGCSASISYAVGEQSVITFNTPLIQPVTCTQLGSITVSATGGSGTYTFNWSNLQTGATIDSLAAGTYSVTATDVNGCSISASYVVPNTAGTLAITNATVVDVTCAGGNNGSITITVSGGTTPYTYLWSTTDNTPGITGLTAGTFTVTVTDANSCSLTASYDVDNGLPLSVTVSATDLICAGTNTGQASATATGGTGGPYTYLWSNAANSTTQTVTGLPWGLIQVTVTDANGCSGTGSDVIQQTQPLSYYRQVDLFLCENPAYANLGIDPRENVGSVLVSVTGVGDTTVTDLGGDTIAYFNNLAAGATYTFTLTDSLGCSVSDNFAVPASASGDNFTVTANATSCFGSNFNDGTITVTPLSGNDPYTYSFNGGTYGSDSVFSSLNAGIYNITAQNIYGCTVALTATVTEPAQLSANATPDTIITAPGQANPVTVNISNYDSAVYIWSPLEASSCADCNNPNLVVNESSAVYVTVSEFNNANCFVVDSVVIIVSGGVKMPNAFSPNNDGRNDFFGPVPMPNTNIVELRIYNRWGAQVHNANTPWDGRANGKEQAPGTFIYYVKVETPDVDNPGQIKTVAQQGSFTLLR